jgi:hypothetical protein
MHPAAPAQQYPATSGVDIVKNAMKSVVSGARRAIRRFDHHDVLFKLP